MTLVCEENCYYIDSDLYRDLISLFVDKVKRSCAQGINETKHSLQLQSDILNKTRFCSAKIGSKLMIQFIFGSKEHCD